MIWNSGRLSPEWTVERLLSKHASAPFNPDVANAFFRGGQIESWGRGIERMVQACLAAGLPPPVLQLEHAGVWVTFTFAHAPVKTSVETPVETPVETLVKTPVETPMAILASLGANPSMTLAEVAAQIGRSVSAVERASAKLVKDGKLKHVGSKKDGHWEILK
jgi:ATP-dependent DNA helicase RecG